MDWQFGILALILLLIIWEIGLLRSVLSAVRDLVDPISRHFDRIERLERDRRVEVGLAEYEEESRRKFQADSDRKSDSG